MYNVKDNAEAKLQVGLSSLSTTLVVEMGNGMLFPELYEVPYILIVDVIGYHALNKNTSAKYQRQSQL